MSKLERLKAAVATLYSCYTPPTAALVQGGCKFWANVGAVLLPELLPGVPVTIVGGSAIRRFSPHPNHLIGDGRACFRHPAFDGTLVPEDVWIGHAWLEVGDFIVDLDHADFVAQTSAQYPVSLAQGALVRRIKYGTHRDIAKLIARRRPGVVYMKDDRTTQEARKPLDADLMAREVEIAREGLAATLTEV